MAEQQTRPTGATPGPTPTRRPWWVWVLIAVVIIVLLVLWLVRCGSGSGSGSGSDPAATGGSVVPSAAPAPAGAAGTAPSAAAAPPSADASTGEPASSSSSSSASPPTGTTGAAGAGTLTAGDSALLPLSGVAGPNGELTALVGRTVTAQSVPVQSVPADEGFWVGPSETDRVWVELTVPPGESPYQVRPGQLVDFTGPMTGQDAGYAGQAGVDAAEGADQLAKEAAHVAVPKADLRIVRG